jgi:sodium/hydrogen exchanger-like protein 6/7
MAIALARMLCVVLLSFILNLVRKNPISWRWQVMIIFSGLRGAFAFALAIRNVSTQARSLMYTTTSIIVILTVVFNGTLAAPVLKWLKIRYRKSDFLLNFLQKNVFRIHVNEEIETAPSNDQYQFMENENNNVRYLRISFYYNQKTNERGEEKKKQFSNNIFSENVVPQMRLLY